MDQMRDPGTGMDNDDRMDPNIRPDEVADPDAAHDWDRHQYVGEGLGDQGTGIVDETDSATHRTWESDEWVGEGQGGSRDREERDRTAHGDTGLSGQGHPAGEAHWDRSTGDDRTRDR